MRLLIVIALAASFASAESHPSWWTLAEPDSTALVGIQWDNLRDTPFASAVAAELSGGGSLGFPDLPLIATSRQILISSPSLLAMVLGNFPADVLRAQASAKGMKPAAYRGIDLWISPGKTLSVARLSDQLILIGLRKTLEDAVDRSQSETRLYSPLLARAARLAPGRDLWVVATQLPDPLASVFVPIEAQCQGFEGAISVSDGLDLSATLDAASDRDAAAIADQLRLSIATLPAIAQTMEVTVDEHSVQMTLQVPPDQLTAALHPTAPAAPAAAPAPTEPAQPEPKQEGPQVIRIYGLDGGTREIILKPKNH